MAPSARKRVRSVQPPRTSGLLVSGSGAKVLGSSAGGHASEAGLSRYAWPVGINRVLRDESGAGVIEYALIVALIALVACAALGLLGQRVGILQNHSSSALPG